MVDTTINHSLTLGPKRVCPRCDLPFGYHKTDCKIVKKSQQDRRDGPRPVYGML